MSSSELGWYHEQLSSLTTPVVCGLRVFLLSRPFDASTRYKREQQRRFCGMYLKEMQSLYISLII